MDDCDKIITMSDHNIKIPTMLFSAVLGLMLFCPSLKAQEETFSIDQRLLSKISLDARNMNIVDVINFLAKKGGFNAVISPSVNGNSSLTLNNVAIAQALNLIARTNHLAYDIDKDIVHVMSESEYQAAFGKRFNDNTEICVIHLQYAKPTYALSVLDNIKSNIGKITIDEDTGSVMLEDTPESIALMKKAIEGIERPLETITYNIKYAKAEELIAKLKTRIDAKAVGTTSADERTNQIFVHVFPGRRQEVEKIINTLDVPTQQVLIEARILQVTIKPTFNSSINWEALIEHNGKNKFNIKTKLINDSVGNSFGQIGVGKLDIDELALQIQDLEGLSDSRILSSPRILATNNEEAKFHVGDSVPYVSTSTTGSGDTAFVIENPRFIDVGIMLTVTPTINDSGMVTMRLKPKFSSIVATLSSRQGGIPQVNSTEIETTLMVEDGTTIMMAGLRQDQKSKSKTGIPKLMNVPYADTLFSKKSENISTTELVILITPHIIKANDNEKKILGTIKSAKQYDAPHDTQASEAIKP